MDTKKNKTSLTVLEKCGISKEMMIFLKKKGLVIPIEIKPFEKHFRSPSEEWFYSIADRYTPPLSEAEIEVYKIAPHLLSLKIQRSVELLMDTSIVLQEALDKVEQIDKDEEKLAAVLSILRIFHGCLDYNHLKHDRHLEYHEYKESPVGYYWWKFRKLIEKAAKKSQISKPEEWINQKSLEIISAPKRPRIVSEYHIAISEVYKKLADNIENIDSLSVQQIIERVEKDFPNLFETIQKFAEEFFRPIDGFIKDCIISKGSNYLEKLIKNKLKSEMALKEVCSKLSEMDAQELMRIVDILDDFANAQDIEGTIFYGLHPYAKNYLTDILIKGYDKLRDLLLLHPQMINPKYKHEVLGLLKAEDVPSKFVANREFMVKLEKFFNEDVVKLCRAAVETWRKI